ncbi:9946_t:CDS:2 [Acaulospora morrowiae]|uniref:9946_t:CDS:1 n=1 Tax=Acaulospora morrowiae TaxID=94023 RepID=A0A9N8YQN8_9GLOM|nr:9946_t:CDS:2 [Acaulospora morrowiae]
MSDSNPLSNIKGEINRLGFVSGEKISLLSHFAENAEKIAVAVSCLDDFDTDEDKRSYLRSLISPPSREQELKRRFDEISFKIDEMNREFKRELKRIRFTADAWYSAIGTHTKTKKGKFVKERGVEILFPLGLTESLKSKSPGKFLQPPNMDKDTRFSPLLDTDFVFIPSDYPLDPLSVIAIGEIKKRVSGSFSNADIGHVISFGEKILQLQPRRSYVYVVLTDCIIINIYRVNRNENHSEEYTQFTYNYIKSEYLTYNTQASLTHNTRASLTHDTQASPSRGWRYLVTIIESSPERLGWVEPSLKFGEETVKLVRSIGVGKTSVVYEGIYKDISVAVKMIKKANYLSCVERERAVLEELSELGSPHIPKILFYDENTLVMTPLGVKVNNLRKTDIKNIITTLKHVHSYEYVHRDLRKYNFLRNLDDSKESILIIDWGFSTKNREDTAFAGALECMPDEVLESLTNEEDIVYGPKVDLICFVRSFYLMLHKPSMERVAFDRDGDIRKLAQMMLNFWKDRSKSDVWDNIYQAIEGLDYDKLIQELERFF